LRSIHFQHCFKRQTGWEEALSRYARGGGRLYDLEFLNDENGRRIAAFGYWAGYAGSGLALLAWAHQITNPDQPQKGVSAFESAADFIAAVKSALEPAIAANNGQAPRPIVIGALGRCGKGAVDLFRSVGIDEDSILKWDLPETKKGGPFTEIAESDVFINCVYLGPHKIPPFVTYESLAIPSRRLRVICDVSCDPNSENNPIPIYSTYSSFGSPTTSPSDPSKISGPELRIIAIDHLPTLVARESSDEYSGLLLPALLDLDKRNNAEDGVWQRAEAVFKDRVSQLPENLR
jgi:saccharopine dehydrogenase (NAD+, L-lysine-forming)